MAQWKQKAPVDWSEMFDVEPNQGSVRVWFQATNGVRGYGVLLTPDEAISLAKSLRFSAFLAQKHTNE